MRCWEKKRHFREHWGGTQRSGGPPIPINCLCILGEVTWPPWAIAPRSESKDGEGVLCLPQCPSLEAALWASRGGITQHSCTGTSQRTIALLYVPSWQFILKVQIKLVRQIFAQQEIRIKGVETPLSVWIWAIAVSHMKPCRIMILTLWLTTLN